MAAHYALWRTRLEQLRPGQRRSLQRRLGVSLAGAALLLALAATPGYGAPDAAITVTNGTSAIANGDGCSLPEAIINANANNQSGSTDCAAGAAGLDTITLNTNVTLTTSNNSTFDPTGLPVMTSAITIEGNGNTISRTSGTFRILAVGSGGNLTLNNATVSGGAAMGTGNANYGGGIYASLTTTATVSNSTLSGNSASNGGGISARSSSLAVSYSTLSGNSATNSGGGIFAYSASVAVSRSLVSGNIAGVSGGEVGKGGGTITAANYNLFGHSGETNAQAFASFTPSGSDITATSDGSTPTALPSILNTTLANNGSQPHPFTHALVSGSPAIDKAPNAACTSAPTNNVDQRGGVRNVDGNSSASSNECDIGAFEYLSTQTPNAIGLRGFAADNGAGGSLAGMLSAALAGLGGLGLGALVARRRRPRRSPFLRPATPRSPSPAGDN